MTNDALSRSRALWNRETCDLRSDEVLAQLLDHGELTAWRELYSLACVDVSLRARILRLTAIVPLSMPYFWRSLMAGLGEPFN